MTNGDKIRGMNDEQLAEFFTDIIDCWHCPTYADYTDVKSCDNALMAWLKKERKERGEE